MNNLEVFFDYACPFCLKGHQYLADIYLLYPDIEIIWRPCEAHPRPERYGLHSDLCIQGMYFALDHGVDIWAYHDIMFHAALIDRINIEDVTALAESVKGLLDADAFRKSLHDGQYTKIQQDANQYAYDLSGIWAVPSYRMNGRKLDSIENMGITKEQLISFIEQSDN